MRALDLAVLDCIEHFRWPSPWRCSDGHSTPLTHAQKFLVGIAVSMDEIAMKDFITTLVGRITLDPASHECQINYRIELDLRNKMASPRGLVWGITSLRAPVSGHY